MDPLMSKLMAPTPDDVVRRSRLEPLVRTIHEKKLTLITAGPGYGKTTIAAQAASQLKSKTIWYRLDESDNDLSRFLSYFETGIQQCFEQYEKQFSENDDQIKNRDIERLALGFLSEFEKKITNDLFITLDDFQVIGDNREIRSFLQAILDHFTPQLHLILVSRSVPDLKFSRLMADRQMTWITSDDLSFDEVEIDLLFKQLLDISLSKAQLVKIMKKTKGWVSGIILFSTSFKTKYRSDLDRAIKHLKGTQPYIFKYLEENIYVSMSEEIRQFVLKTACLDHLDVNLCNRLLDTNHSKHILSQLEDNHNFTFSIDEDRNSFNYHPLFQEFLLAKIEIEFSTDQTRHLHSILARFHQTNKDHQTALKHHILSGNIDGASKLLDHLARPIIKQGQPQKLASLLSIIPDQHMDNEPWFQYLQAGHLKLNNRPHQAAKVFLKVLDKFCEKKNRNGECFCRMELADYYMALGEFGKSEEEYRHILDLNRLDPYMTIVVMGYFIRVLTLSRKITEANNYIQKASFYLTKIEDEASLKKANGWLLAAQGFRFAFCADYHKALEFGEQSIYQTEPDINYRTIFSGYFLISYSSFYLGQFSKGITAALEGIKKDGKEGDFDGYKDFLHLMYARNRIEMDDISNQEMRNLQKDTKKILQTFKSGSFQAGVVHAYLVLYRAAFKLENTTRAERYLRKGIAVLDENDLPQLKNELKVTLSYLLFFYREKEHNKEAMILIKAAEKELAYSAWHMFRISMIYARYYWEHNHMETCFDYIVHSLKLCEKKNFDVWLLKEKNWIIPLLIHLYAMKTMQGYLETIFPTLHKDTQNHLAELKNAKRKDIKKAAQQISKLLPKKTVPAISAAFLGQFRLSVGSEGIPESRWKSKKARTLMKYLLCMRDKGFLDKEILMELLWPNEDPQKSARRFHVALAALRKVLEPSIIKGTKSSYIKRSGGAYRIDIGKDGHLDIEAFKTLFKRATKFKDSEESIPLYMKVESLYRGDFLQEDPYEQWCVDEREKYRQNYLFALKKIIHYHEKKQDYATCISYAEKYLKIEPYEENVLRSLMQYYAFNGNKPMIIRIYEKFKTSIHQELDCAPSHETETLYTQLVTV